MARKNGNQTIAVFFMLIFFPSLLPFNLLYASNNGPISPEAASFEPVDATDMVNLLTGSYSYVLPLVNVPSPEGGYPLALSYHGGVTVDQEATWAGLGWNVNPGAILRNINNYPDDYHNTSIDEYYYDKGDSGEAYALSVGYSAGAYSVGLGATWGSHQSVGGFVSAGVGFQFSDGSGVGVNFSAGSNGASVGVGYTSPAGLSVGLTASTNGGVDAVAGFSNNGSGFSISSSGALTIKMQEKNASIGMTLSSAGAQLNVGINNSGKSIRGVGIGLNTSFSTTISMGDYNFRSSGWTIPIIVPTNIGVFSLSFGKQEFSYELHKAVSSYVSGPVHFALPRYKVKFRYATDPAPIPGRRYDPYSESFFTEAEAQAYAAEIQSDPNYIFMGMGYEDCFSKFSFFDINEVPIAGNQLGTYSEPEFNNVVMPSYDNYSVQAQGLAGSMSTTLFENGALYGLSDKAGRDYKLNYINNICNPINSEFDGKANFYFDNEISTFIDVQPASFNLNSNNNKITDHYSGGVNLLPEPRRKTATFVQYYTNRELHISYQNIKAEGFLNPANNTIDRTKLPQKGIGAFKVTAADGKTYHYSLPVYNYETVTRTFGLSTQNPTEDKAYFEKRQLEPYATHWLLTAVTGPDYVDNGDGVAGTGDLGYWTSFEYGKFSEAFSWKAPYKKNYISNPVVRGKTWIKGRKDLYYLDRIKTRTHTALFVKSTRYDAPAAAWNYGSVNHVDGQYDDPGDYVTRFVIPQQYQMKLEKIILLKNEDDNVSKTHGQDFNRSVAINFGKGAKVAGYDRFDNILDYSDNWQNSVPKALKVIHFDYDYTLVPGDNRLTLKSVEFRGRQDKSVLPPYKFEYNNPAQQFNIENKDNWGYNKTNPAAWSLKKITTPTGAQIIVDYEPHTFREVFQSNVEAFYDAMFYQQTLKKHQDYGVMNDASNSNNIILFTKPGLLGSRIQVGDVFDYKYRASNYSHIPISWTNPEASKICSYDGTGTVISGTAMYIGNLTTLDEMSMAQHLGNDIERYVIQKTTGSYVPHIANGCNMPVSGYYHSLRQHDYNREYSGAGIRVKSVTVTDGTRNYITSYKYTNPNSTSSSGYVSYNPNNPESRDIPYSAVLPAPRVMYEYVTMENLGSNGQVLNKLQYRFNVMKEKSTDQIKFGNFLSIEYNRNNFNNTQNKLVDVASYTIKDNLSTIGQLLEIITYNTQGHQLKKITNKYFTPEDIPNNLGKTRESYQTYKEVDFNDNRQDRWIVNSTSRIVYPNMIKSSAELSSGYSHETQFGDYDPISGSIREKTMTSSTGQSIKLRTVPAYLKYGPMGSKVDNINNTNMITQAVADYSYILDNGVWKETGVGITTWSNEWTYKNPDGTEYTPSQAKEKVWRTHKSYSWNGIRDINGIFSGYDSNTDDGFNWSIGVGQSSRWQQNAQVTLYDRYSTPLEVMDINGNYASSKMGNNNTRVVAKGNARLTEMYYTGGEYVTSYNNSNWYEDEVNVNGTQRVAGIAHTGRYSVKTTSASKLGVVMKSGQHRLGRYKLSVWVHKDNASKARVMAQGALSNFNGEVTYTAGDWVLKTHYLDNVTAADYSIYVTSVDNSVVYFDDFRVLPAASSITNYVYDEWDQLSFIIDPFHLSTKFVYDEAGRLRETYMEVVDDPANGLVGGFKKVSASKIHYKSIP